MVVIIRGREAKAHPRLFETMFEDRKRLFVDLMKWDVPVIAGRFERDQFDGDEAIYLIALEPDGSHAGSMRLLPTTSPHILGELFPGLCAGAVPRGGGIFEITRLCLPARHRAGMRLVIRNRLISAMVDHALASGIQSLTGVVQASFLVKILDMGWRARALGELRRSNHALLGAFRLEIDDQTPSALARNWIYSPRSISEAVTDRAAAA